MSALGLTALFLLLSGCQARGSYECSRNVTEDAPFKLTCEVSGPKPLEVQWLVTTGETNSGVLMGSCNFNNSAHCHVANDSYELGTYGSSASTSSTRLTVKRDLRNPTVTCKVDGAAGGQRSCTINVEYECSGGRELTVKEGEPFSLTCALPRVQITSLIWNLAPHGTNTDCRVADCRVSNIAVCKAKNTTNHEVGMEGNTTTRLTIKHVMMSSIAGTVTCMIYAAKDGEQKRVSEETCKINVKSGESTRKPTSPRQTSARAVITSATTTPPKRSSAPSVVITSATPTPPKRSSAPSVVITSATPTPPKRSSAPSVITDSKGKKDNADDEDDDRPPIAIIAGTAGGGLVIIVVIVVIVIIVMKRRKDSQQSGAETDGVCFTNNSYTGADADPARALLPATADGASANQSAAPPPGDMNAVSLAEDISFGYSIVSLSQPPRPSASRPLPDNRNDSAGLYSTVGEEEDCDKFCVAAEAAGPAEPLTGDVYAVVKKPRKSPAQPTDPSQSGHPTVQDSGDVYAVVQKKPKGNNPIAGQKAEAEGEVYAQVRKKKASAEPAVLTTDRADRRCQ
ncbi:uncharacterized protein LOC143291498 isoform X2 [Babylonia areolata]|uniref:uncharacterized protein LOC143291498 isoform X1 n=1 Tax=Babylonia areolata TaxID=304850 RepID=UPI003FD2CB5D